MKNITFETIKDENIEICRGLCNELMEFQQSKAIIHPEKFDDMNFDTRMKSSCEKALDSQIVIARDGNTPVGYVFSTLDYVTAEDKNAYPGWAPQGENNTGFYPDWVKTPRKIGVLSNLYLRGQYRHMRLGSKLFEAAMEWLQSLRDIELIFVFISNGNTAALDFYLSHGFTFSHDVFGGFIQAAYRRVSAG
ncbi:MAG: GNAT family N-acetyltransferase [Clostridiales Family XIII bacterium]|nr:GNAT family N-acetyltransferase [Clostridiales Family XIII bacterium]